MTAVRKRPEPSGPPRPPEPRQEVRTARHGPDAGLSVALADGSVTWLPRDVMGDLVALEQLRTALAQISRKAYGQARRIFEVDRNRRRGKGVA